MSKPRVCVLRAPGTNCDIETAHAFSLAGGEPERLHLFRLLEDPGWLRQYQILCIPGGFSYGDDIGAGVVFGSHLREALRDSIGEFLAGDKLVLGICNGFQVLLKSGILPGGASTWPPAADAAPEATLTWNRNGRYTATWVNLTAPSKSNVFVRGIEQLELPVAHGEGRIAVADPGVLSRWHDAGQIVLAYTDGNPGDYSPAGEILDGTYNPNASIGNIAGLGDPTGRVLGLMPHPERFLFATQHPQWTRKRLSGPGAGQKLFSNAVEYFTAR
jgi:phosphoribosylformylglycinamidine synthase